MKNWLTSGLVLGILLLISLASCREDFEFEPKIGQLQFSKDTVYLDTIFTNIGSSTYALKVYNKSSENILIPEINLKSGPNSKYRLNVDGVAGKSFDQVPLLAKDSLFVFIETTFDIATTGANEFLHTDALRFGGNDVYQEVQLVTLVRDAHFLYPGKTADGQTETISLGVNESGETIEVPGFTLQEENLNFTKEKPYVIYGYASVSANNTLSIAAGARVYFHQNSGLLVSTGAGLRVNGMLSEDAELLEQQVVFEGDRLEPAYAGIPGQWGGIIIQDNAQEISITHLTIKNAITGISIQGSSKEQGQEMLLHNTQIHNSANTNLRLTASTLKATNCVFGSAANYSLYCSLSGNYEFLHCTIANYNSAGFREVPALGIENLRAQQGDLNSAMKLRFSNCIIDGNLPRELGVFNDASTPIDFLFLHTAIKYEAVATSNVAFNFENNNQFREVVLSPDVNFVNPKKLDFQLTKSSPVLNLGAIGVAENVPLDILGKQRLDTPDLGAYEFIP